MRLRWISTVLLSAATAYYIYLPLPTGVCEPWKLMLLDALFRGFINVCDLAEALGLGQSVQMLNALVLSLEVIEPRSSPTVRVSDSALGGVATRVFQPIGGETLKRGVLYFHGGGWALGSGRMRSYDLLCRKMAEDLDAVVMSVDYRLAPQVVFPGQYQDAMAAAHAVLSPAVLQLYSLDPQRLCVSGDSAGGNLAAVIAQEIGSDENASVKFKAQALIYPVVQSLDFHTPSYQQNHNVPILYRHLMARFWLLYLGADHSLSPLLLANNHSSLDQPSITPHTRSKLNWTSLLPDARRKHYRPVVKVTGSQGVVEKVPGLVDVRAAPLLSERGILSRTPQAYVMTCEFDVLRDDGLMYARRLEEAGVAVTSDHYEDGFHGCMAFSVWPVKSTVGQRSLENYIKWLDQNL